MLDSRCEQYVKLSRPAVKTPLRDLLSLALHRVRAKNERADHGKSFFELMENVDLTRQGESAGDSFQQHLLGEWLEQNSDGMRPLNKGLSP